MTNHTAEPPTMAEIMRDGYPPAMPIAIAQQSVLDAPASAPSGTEADVCADIAARQRAGIAKYGTTVRDNPLQRKEWIRHAYEEALDLAVYLKRLMENENEP